MMFKFNLLLFAVILCIKTALPDPVNANHLGQVAAIDTIRLYDLAFKGKRFEAASYLYQRLSQPQKPGSYELADMWLHAALFSAWSDSLSSSIAFSNFNQLSNQSITTPATRANVLLYQALLLSLAGSNNKAADSLAASIAIRPVYGSLNRILLADSYGKLARLFKRTGDLYESARNFDRSISLNRTMGRVTALAEDLSDLSSVLSTMNKSDRRADSVLLESLSIYLQGNRLPAIAQVYNELGVLSNHRGNFRQSLDYFRQSLQVKSKIPGLNKQEFIAVINNIGHCYQYLGKSDSARLYFEKAIDFALLSSNRGTSSYNSKIASLYANLGANFGGDSLYTKAIEYFQKSLWCLDSTCSLADPSTNPHLNKVTPELAEFTAYKAHSFNRRYYLLHNPKDLIDGLNTFMVALDMMDTLRFMYSFESKPYLSSEAKIHYFKAFDMALDLNNLTGEKKYLDQAFQLSQRNKSATLNEFIRTNQAREYMGSVAPWIFTEDSIKQLINKIQSRLIASSVSINSVADSILSMQSQLSHLTDKLKNIGVNARRQNPDYFKMVYSNRGYKPEEIQELLDPGEALVDYTVVRDNRLNMDYMIVFVLSRDTLFNYRATLPNQFRKDIKAFRASITSYVDTRIFQEFCRSSYLMYQYFFAPLEKNRGITKLIILPDEELGFLPFEAFITDTIKPRGSDFRKLKYLNRNYQISYISSQEQLYQFRHNKPKTEKSTVYAFAPFVDQGVKMDTLNLLPLENSGKETSYISKYFRTRTYLNKRAGEQSLRHAFQRPGVLVLSTHGIMDAVHPLQSRLLLNPSEPDGSLYLFEMMSLKIQSPLVILNACNTGTGKLQVGEGILSMARGFQFAGVPSVITTLWPIDDQSSALVMKYFFKNMQEGMDQREALMRARNTYIDQATKATGAPYFWAGQVLIGNTGKISLHQKVNPWLIVISLISIGFLAAFFIILHKKVR